jgi:hypothetical protein
MDMDWTSNSALVSLINLKMRLYDRSIDRWREMADLEGSITGNRKDPHGGWTFPELIDQPLIIKV